MLHGGGTAWAAVKAAPEVLAVYPATRYVPANVLRFYIRFSQPMQEMGILQHVHLQDAAGHDLSGVFFENQYELWNAARTEVTLLLDPGRVKTGLRAHEQLGWAFHPGQVYTLRVDDGLLNFRDQPLRSGFVHRFTAVNADTTAPDPGAWKVVLPKARGRDALRIDLQESLDHISARSLIQVLCDGRAVLGEVRLYDNERQWRFTPARPWRPGHYRIRVARQLEDIAGNSVLQAFDHPIGQTPAPLESQILQFDL